MDPCRQEKRLNDLETNEARMSEQIQNLARKIDRFANATMGLIITVVGGLFVTIVGGFILAAILYFLNLGGA